MVVAESAALPVDGFGNAAFIFSVDDLLHARNDVRVAVIAKLNHDPATTYLLGDCAGSSGTGERVKD